ncbi:hypothetical protein E2C01_083212 [Portunus trituberculatus]|uniref:Uncharacterized protein n=1 Tax=Portunus trituberculatus TaxID=210409 RepID=A0A5B7IRV6_PORTR|nr:hypothetical protein [Portunus trituberculatus]
MYVKRSESVKAKEELLPEIKSFPRRKRSGLTFRPKLKRPDWLAVIHFKYPTLTSTPLPPTSQTPKLASLSPPTFPRTEARFSDRWE